MWDVSDEALFAGYAAGDPDAAAVFVRRFQTQVYGLALAIVSVPGDAEDVADAVGRHDDAARVAGIMRSLPDAQREALVAVTMLGFTTREVSRMASVPQATVKTRIRLALRKLRVELGARV